MMVGTTRDRLEAGAGTERKSGGGRTHTHGRNCREENDDDGDTRVGKGNRGGGVTAVASVCVCPAAAARSFCSRASLQSIPGCSHHRWGTRVPPRRSVPSHIPRIGRVAMNCATVFCLRRTDVLACTIPAYFVAPARGRSSHFPPLPRRGRRPVSRRATLPWNASRAASILLVRTQVSSPKRRTCCVTAI